MMSESFYRELPPFARFDRVTQKSCFHPLPDDWLIGVADIENSTGAIKDGRYKMVNMAGASVISAIMNVLGNADFPYVFGGDGAGFGVPDSNRTAVEKALAACRAWATADLELSLRVAMVPMRDIRSRGLDVTVARFQPSPNISYAMFSGGGLAWAEAAMKDGAYEMPSAPADARPDLTGLSCRFRPIAARNGQIVSLLVSPGEAGEVDAFADLVGRILATIEAAADRAGHPIEPDGPRFVWPPAGLGLEAKAGAPGSARLLRGAAIVLEHLIPWFLQAARSRLGGFDPAVYRRDVAENTDFRKFDDGLKLTIDCAPDTASALEEILTRAEKAGIARYGLHRQERALMTCIVPSPFTRDHMHFVDGAAGGYASAAVMLKKKIAEAGGRNGAD